MLPVSSTSFQFDWSLTDRLPCLWTGTVEVYARSSSIPRRRSDSNRRLTPAAHPTRPWLWASTFHLSDLVEAIAISGVFLNGLITYEYMLS